MIYKYPDPGLRFAGNGKEVDCLEIHVNILCDFNKLR